MARLGIAMVLLLTGAALFPLDAWAAETTETQHWIRLLESNAPKQEKDAACRQAKRSGNSAWVPALAGLLTDPDLSHSARYALETLPGPEAGNALLQALEQTTGPLQAGVIHSLAVRRETAAAEKITLLLVDTEPVVVTAAAGAMADLRTSGSAEVLFSALQSQEDVVVRNAIYDSLLSVASQLMAENKKSRASGLFKKLQSTDNPDHIRTAAFAGQIASADERRALELMVSGIRCNDGAERIGALQMAGKVSGGRHATSVLCELVRDLTDPAPKIALIAALEQRGDETALPTLILLADADDKNVRTAAISAMGSLGGATAIPALAKAAVSGREAEQDAARHAMLRINGADVADALLNQMVTGSPIERREVARALVARAEPGTTQKLFQLITSENSKVSNLALETIGRIATEKDVPRLVEIVSQTSDTSIRTGAGSALAKACARLTANGTEPDAAPFIEAFHTADLQTHIALLPAAVMLQDAGVRQHIRQVMTTSTLPLRDAAVTSLFHARDVEYVPDLLAIVKQSEDAHLRIRLLRAALRLATDRGRFPEDNKRQIELLKAIAPLATRPEEKWALLGGLAETGSREALELAVPMLNDDATRAEAVQAVAKLVLALPPKTGEYARPALQKVLDTASDSAMRATAETAMKHIGKRIE